MSTMTALLLTAPPPGQPADDAAMTKIDGRESALRAMELLTNREPVGQIYLVIDPQTAEEVKRKIGSHLMFMGVKLVQAAGGWYAQLAAAAAKLPHGSGKVLVHDAARPAVPYTDLEALLATEGPAVALAVPVRGTLANANVVPGPGTVEAHKLAAVLTPRVYERDAFDALCRDGTEPALTLIEGSPLNVRCGEVPAGIVKALVQLLPKPKVKTASPFEEAQW